MKISNQQLIGWQATPDMASWFLIRFPDGDTEYQDVLTALAEDDRPDDAQWLMDNAGADNCGRFDLTDFETHKHVFAAGAVVIGWRCRIRMRRQAPPMRLTPETEDTWAIVAERLLCPACAVKYDTGCRIQDS